MFTYSPEDPTSDLARLRLHIGDTIETLGPRYMGRNFSDEELAAFISDAGGWALAVPAVLRAMANEYAAAARNTRLEGFSEDLTQTYVALREQAAEWERTHDATGATFSGMAAGQIVVDIFASGGQSYGLS